MIMNIRINDEMNPARAAKVMDVLRAPRLWIPTYEDYGASVEGWLGKVEQELIDGKRHALYAQVGRQASGTVVWRPDIDDTSMIDIRNISIDPQVKGRYFGAFMVRNVEQLAREQYPNASTVRVDTKATNIDMLAFLARQGYSQQGTFDLYNSNKSDVILHKSL